MSRMLFWSVSTLVLIGLVLNGCTPSAQLSLQMQEGQVASYESTTTMVKDYKFDQPTMKKSDHNQTSTTITLMFDQTITSVAADGTATADVVIKGIRCKTVNKNQVRYEFNSDDPNSKADTLNQLIGQSYRISISPAGQIQVVDANAIRAAATGGEGVNLVKKSFSDESIIERHQLPLPEDIKALSAQQSWTEVVPSPPGLLAPKTFEKTYTVAEAGKNRVVIDMTAKESLGKKADGQSSSGAMGMFAKMFDSQDTFSGKLVFNPSNGSVELYEETLVSTYTASEMPQNAPADALPDTLVMSLTNGISLKKIQ